MTPHGWALAFVDLLAAAGVALTLADDGALHVEGSEPPEALEGALAAFAALPELPAGLTPDEVAERVSRSVRAPLTPEGLEELLRTAREASPLWWAVRAVLRAPGRAAREVLALPVWAAASGLPVPFTLTLDRRGALSVCTTSRRVYADAQGRLPVWLARELECAAVAVEMGRASPAHLDRWLDAKRKGGGWQLTRELAGLDVPGAPATSSITVGALCDALGAELVGVELHEPAKEAA